MACKGFEDSASRVCFVMVFTTAFVLTVRVKLIEAFLTKNIYEKFPHRGRRNYYHYNYFDQH